MNVSLTPLPDLRRISRDMMMESFVSGEEEVRPIRTPSLPSARPKSGSRRDLSRARFSANSWWKEWMWRMAVAR